MLFPLLIPDFATPKVEIFGIPVQKLKIPVVLQAVSEKPAFFEVPVQIQIALYFSLLFYHQVVDLLQNSVNAGTHYCRRRVPLPVEIDSCIVASIVSQNYPVRIHHRNNVKLVLRP